MPSFRPGPDPYNPPHTLFWQRGGGPLTVSIRHFLLIIRPFCPQGALCWPVLPVILLHARAACPPLMPLSPLLYISNNYLKMYWIMAFNGYCAAVALSAIAATFFASAAFPASSSLCSRFPRRAKPARYKLIRLPLGIPPLSSINIPFAIRSASSPSLNCRACSVSSLSAIHPSRGGRFAMLVAPKKEMRLLLSIKTGKSVSLSSRPVYCPRLLLPIPLLS